MPWTCSTQLHNKNGGRVHILCDNSVGCVWPTGLSYLSFTQTHQSLIASKSSEVSHNMMDRLFPLYFHKVVEHLETRFGVQVQHVTIHKMKYAFQIWSAMMSSRDSDGQVRLILTRTQAYCSREESVICQ